MALTGWDGFGCLARYREIQIYGSEGCRLESQHAESPGHRLVAVGISDIANNPGDAHPNSRFITLKLNQHEANSSYETPLDHLTR